MKLPGNKEASTVEAQNFDGAQSSPIDTQQSRHSSFIPKLRLPLAVLIGSGITAGTTYALVKHVQHLIAHASVSSDPNVWLQKARTDGYDACYNGCDDCRDISFAYNACLKTSTAIVPGTICDGNRMWNWLDRYPTSCLEALGAIYKSEAIGNKKKGYRNQLAIIILTVLAGVLAAFLIYKFWPHRLRGKPARSHNVQPESISSPPPYEPPEPKVSRSKRRIKWPRLWRGAAAASVVGTTRAFPCYGYGTSDQFFTNSNKTISGVIHGWVASCHTEPYICGQTCSTTHNSKGGSTTSCSPTWCTRTVMDSGPHVWVSAAAQGVKSCGFSLVDNVLGDVGVRVANPAIERNLWVKISVDRYNVTASETDLSVICLHGLGS